MAEREHGDDGARLRAVALGVAGFVALLWGIQAALVLGGWSGAPFGVRPRAAEGLVGILTAPLVHGSWGHLVGNTPALLVLGVALLIGTPSAARIAVPAIWLTSGLGVWLFAREAIHIGASGLTYGLMFFVFTVGIARRDRRSIALALLVFFLYGSMIWGVFPSAPGISFEYHLFGALAGTACAFLLRRRDPLPERKRYDWEDDRSGEAANADRLFFAERDAADEPRR